MNKHKQRDMLTNEYIKKNFSDNFSLALASIEVAKNMIRSGRDFTLNSLLDTVAKSAELKKIESEDKAK